MSQPSRREILVMGTLGACAACVFSAAGQPARANQPVGRGPVDVGTPADYPDDGIYDQFSRRHRFFVMRQNDQIFAVSAICTHKNQIVRKTETGLECPAHGSKFSEFGTFLDGPAGVSLPRLKVVLNDQGRIIVDPAEQFDERDWDKPDAFIDLKR